MILLNSPRTPADVAAPAKEDKVRKAYHKIQLAYQPGDEIVLIGFSRGAFIARIVAEIIVRSPLSRRAFGNKLTAVCRETLAYPLAGTSMRFLKPMQSCRIGRTRRRLGKSRRQRQRSLRHSTSWRRTGWRTLRLSASRESDKIGLGGTLLKYVSAELRCLAIFDTVGALYALPCLLLPTALDG